MKNINIPEPCSENWNEMTPNEKGAFCQKCALDVYDFTNKSGDEIRDILTLNIGSPVCMRIQPKQLDQLNNDFSAWKINNKQSYHRAWVFTLFVVFGMTLFSCEEDEVPVVEKFQKIGQTILTEEKNDKSVDSLDYDEAILDDIEVECAIQGEPGYEMEILGAMEYRPEHAYPIDEIVIVGEKQIRQEIYATAGIPAISQEYEGYLLEAQDGASRVNEVVENEEITGLVYPNPASNETTLKVNMPSRGKGEIELFALGGQKIRSIHSGRLKKGETEFAIDLTDLEMGMYMVVISSGEIKETVKFTKI